MKFAEIYRTNIAAMHENLKSLWCSEAASDKQRAYATQLEHLIETELFSSEDYMPLVQSMERYKSVSDVENKDAMQLIGEELWFKVSKGEYKPYVHQYESWKSLLCEKECRSMVVTTGTGSGKTECFMLPLVHDLAKNRKEEDGHCVKAVFLYPLNALMEDQKSRLQKLLEKTGLTFAVYNGNLPTNRYNEKDQEYAEKEKSLYPNIIPTREELRSQKADILLTNPTMLEYMLLRAEDQTLFNDQALKWVVIDEAHTFTGAAAAELSMLLRRVVNAFGKESSQIHFAASSATIGNGIEKAEQEENMKRFLADIGGIDTQMVDVITGEPNKDEISGNDEYAECRRKLREAENGYIKLNDLIKEGASIQEKLERLDELCDEDKYENPIRAKVHYFYRIPNNGITVQLDKWADGGPQSGILELHSKTPADTKATPSLEICRCNCCGEYFAIGLKTTSSTQTYKAEEREDSDMFDFADSTKQEIRFLAGVVPKDADRRGNTFVKVNGNEIAEDQNPQYNWVIAVNIKGQCPHCGSQIYGKKDKSHKGMNKAVSPNGILEIDEETAPRTNFTRMRISADYVARVLSPSLLSQMSKTSDADAPHQGQQYLSFVDSRSSAARSTFRQMLDVEKYWAYSRVFHELNRAAKEHSDYMKWNEIYDYLSSQPDGELLCKQFVDRVGNNEVNEDGDIQYYVKERYFFAVMLEQLAKYPPHSATAETMGLIESYYPLLENIKAPQEFIDFCHNCGRTECDEELDNEWRNFIKIYMDRVVRSNESIYLEVAGHPDSDIHNCYKRFGTKKPPRRTARKPLVMDEMGPSLAISHLLLAKLIAPNAHDYKSIVKRNKNEINCVINKMWEQVEDIGLLSPSRSIAKKYTPGRERPTWKADLDTDEDKRNVSSSLLHPNNYQLRLNVANLAFKLPRKVHMCKIKKGRNTVVRPVTTLFFGYAPYNLHDDLSAPLSSEDWIVDFPYNEGLRDGLQVTTADIDSWAKENRGVLFRYNLWGKNGCFTNQLRRVYSFPRTFVQAEHTAQVNKEMSRLSQMLFKDHKINILACSTTMEMGVDLGDLDLVMMSSIPPHPANYKQRAGRSGRNTNTRSASITLCSSDAVGLRVLNDPMRNIISRPVDVPFVDLNCPTIIQRHANAFLLRDSRKLEKLAGSNLTVTVLNVFTRFQFDHDQLRPYLNIGLLDNNLNRVYPNTKAPLGDQKGTIYEEFETWLENDAKASSLEFLVRNTALEGSETKVLANTKEEWESRKEELEESLKEIATIYESEIEKIKKKPTPKARVINNCQLDSPYGRYLEWKYLCLLQKRLIDHLATHRFTPNADMPVDVIELNVYNEKTKKYGTRPDNPSYPLRQALSQYAPGNVIVKENRILTIAGVDFYGKEGAKEPFLKFVTDGVDVVEGINADKLSEPKIPWKVNSEETLSLVRVRGFQPDINDTDNRNLENSVFTQVNSQLIGAEKWNLPSNFSHLMAVRCNENDGRAKILYYNEGIGYGYCLCRQCGKMVLETGPCAGNKTKNLPEEMCAADKMLYKHYAIDRLDDKGKPRLCKPTGGNYDRNVIIGELIQTDYCEIRIRADIFPHWGGLNDNVKTTLGLVFCLTFTQSIGKDRDAIDFTIMPNGNLCIYDTNPGGSGYSNHLADPNKTNDIVRRSLDFLNSIDSKDALLDKFTLRYLNRIDIEGAKEWLKAEIDSWEILPQNIVDAGYSKATWATFYNIKKDLETAALNNKEAYIFSDDNFETWFYDVTKQECENEQEAQREFVAERENETWKQRMLQVIQKNLNKSRLVLGILGNRSLILPAYSTLTAIEQWCKPMHSSMQLANGIYPLAIVNGNFYFTDNKELLHLNHDWANGDVFCISANCIEKPQVQDIDMTLPRDSVEFKIGEPATDKKNINSDELFDLVCHKCKQKQLDVISFLEEYRNVDARLEITYQDEHLKSAYAMVTTLQFISKILEHTGKTNNFHLTFLNEDYDDRYGTIDNPYKGLADADLRDQVLEELTNEWLTEVLNDAGNSSFRIERQNKGNRLPHWRVLTVECGGKQISFYPNGGFINEWFFDNRRGIAMLSDIDDMKVEDTIPLYRRNRIKYEVIIDHR